MIVIGRGKKKANIEALIEKEIVLINSSLETQHKYNDYILSYLSDFTKNITSATSPDKLQKVDTYLANLNKLLDKSRFNTFILKQLLRKIDDIKADNNSSEKVEAYNKMYDIFYDNVIANLAEIQSFFEGKGISEKMEKEEERLDEIIEAPKASDNDAIAAPISETIIEEPAIEKIVEEIKPKKSNKKSEKIVQEEIDNIEAMPPVKKTIAKEETTTVGAVQCADLQEEKTVKEEKAPEGIIEKTLIISEDKGKVILPYTLKEINKFIAKYPEDYSTVEDVIGDLYTIPLEEYKSTAISRFKEAFRLIRERENGSFLKALDLALEVMPNYSLHPAVITACKDLDELDIYLSCLEYDELEDFDCFNIEFNSLPTLKSKVKTVVKKGKDLKKSRLA